MVEDWSSLSNRNTLLVSVISERFLLELDVLSPFFLMSSFD